MATFSIGDRIEHKVFGEDDIMDIDSENSAKLTILFEEGRKAIMSSYVKLLK